VIVRASEHSDFVFDDLVDETVLVGDAA